MTARALVVSALACTALLAGVGGAGSYAFWTDEQQVDGAAFEAGSLDLQVDGSSADVSWSELGLASVAPGESVAASLSLSNAGSTAFTTTVAGSASGGLAAYAVVTLSTGATPSSADVTYPREATCDGGTEHFTGTLGSLADLATLGPLAPGADRDLCVVVALPQSAPNAAQGTTTTPVFTFTAEQVLP